MATTLTAAVGAGITRCALPLTLDLRHNARGMGWSEKAVAGLKVVSKAREFSIEKNDAAMAAEYGDLDNGPVPAALIWANDTTRVESIVVECIYAHLIERGVL